MFEKDSQPSYNFTNENTNFFLRLFYCIINGQLIVFGGSKIVYFNKMNTLIIFAFAMGMGPPNIFH